MKTRRNETKHRKDAILGRHLGGSLIAVALLFVSLVGSAQAVPLHTTPFPPITGSGIGTSFVAPLSVAVDETSGNIFVPSGKRTFDQDDNVIYIMNSEGGVPAGVAAPYKIDPGIEFGIDYAVPAVDNAPLSPSKGALYVPDHHGEKVLKYELNPTTEQYELAETLTAVPNLGVPEAVTADGQGNVYVASPFNGNGVSDFGAITKFSPSGTQLAQIKMTEATRIPRSIAVNSVGDVFVSNSDQVFKFPANGLGEIEASNFIEIPLSHQSDGITVDRQSNTLYVTAGKVSAEFDATSLIEKGSFEFPASVGEGDSHYRGPIAVNHAAGLIYSQRPFVEKDLPVLTLDGPALPDVGTTAPTEVGATKVTLNGLVNPHGLAVTECKFTTEKGDLPCEGALPADNSPHTVSAVLTGLSPNHRYSYGLSATNANGTNRADRKFVDTDPIVKTTAATGISASGATLNGIVHPEGAPMSECKFEYGPTAAYGTTVPCSPEASAIPADFTPHTVSATLGGLTAGATYHFRVVGSGGLGGENGEDLSFTTLGPTIGGTFVSLVGETTATLRARANPHGKAATYHFEYGTEPCGSGSCESVPVPDASAGSIDATQVTCSEQEEHNSHCVPYSVVSQQLQGLARDTTYHYRVVVTNPDGTSVGSENTFTTFDVAPNFGACPNDAFRADRPSAKLPDCRAFEQATPIDKNGGDVGGDIFKIQASLSGDGITSQTQGGIPGGEGAQDFPPVLSQRGATGWSTQGFLPPPGFGDQVAINGWTPDLAYSVSVASLRGSNQTGETDRSLLLRSSATHEVQQLTPYFDGAGYGFAAASTDDSKFFFDVHGPALAGGAAGKDNPYLYDRVSEEMSLVGVLPNGTTPPGGSFFGPYDWWRGIAESSEHTNGLDYGGSFNEGLGTGFFLQELHAISADGDKAFFTTAGIGQLYLRKGLTTESPETVQVSASQSSTPDPNGPKPAIFMDAAVDGSTAFFTSCEKLTDDSTAHSTAVNNCETESQGQDLYAYDSASGDLSDLTVDPDDPNGADVKAVLGAAADGSYVYFIANGDLDGSGPAKAGNCQHVAANFFYNGVCSLYAWHGGSSTFVARLEAAGNSFGDVTDWLPNPNLVGDAAKGERTARVSADGQVVVFHSSGKQIDCGNTNSDCEGFYRYRFGDPTPTCITCNMSGTPGSSARARSIVPAGLGNQGRGVLTRFVSEDGSRVFFETRLKLVGADTNGDQSCPNAGPSSVDYPACQDVYEWEAPGAGSCNEASSAYYPKNHGCLYLISSGTGSAPTFFADASASGKDVFIFTREQLVPSDRDQLVDVYDARVGGGLASQNQPPPPTPCEGSACRGVPTAPSGGQSAGSASFSGPGNPPLKRCPKGKVSKRGKCVKQNKKKPDHKGHAKQRAGGGQGGGK